MPRTSSARQKLDPGCDTWRAELGACEAGPGFGVIPQEIEEVRGCVAAPRSGAESLARLLASDTRERAKRECRFTLRVDDVPLDWVDLIIGLSRNVDWRVAPRWTLPLQRRACPAEARDHFRTVRWTGLTNGPR